MQVRFLPAGPRKQCDEAREDRERQELERKLFEAYAEPKGYNLTRIAINKFDVSKSAYKNDVVLVVLGRDEQKPDRIGKAPMTEVIATVDDRAHSSTIVPG